MKGSNGGRNGWLIAAVLLITALPLWLVEPPADGAALFTGADEKARQAIGEVAPEYRPWMAPLMEPASGEIASLLFALQAALGAGIIGYWLGVSLTREKFRREAERRAAAEAENSRGEAGSMPSARRACAATEAAQAKPEVPGGGHTRC